MAKREAKGCTVNVQLSLTLHFDKPASQVTAEDVHYETAGHLMADRVADLVDRWSSEDDEEDL